MLYVYLPKSEHSTTNNISISIIKDDELSRDFTLEKLFYKILNLVFQKFDQISCRARVYHQRWHNYPTTDWPTIPIHSVPIVCPY